MHGARIGKELGFAYLRIGTIETAIEESHEQ